MDVTPSASGDKDARRPTLTGGRSFTTYLVGGTSMLIQCAEILLEKGNIVSGVLSSDEDVIAWAQRRQVKLDANSTTRLKAGAVDYLFSVNNLSVLDAELIGLARWAINFHDGPLPRYAGVNAPVWAILNQETEYRVTWHIMSPGVDEGNILVQRPVFISPADTALTLNTKCYEAGIQAFRELLDQLADDTTNPLPQDLTLRSYFPRWRRPHAACLLRWDQPAEKLAALARALETGHYVNLMGTPKVLLGDEAIAVARVESLEWSGAPPGTVVEVDEQSLRVAAIGGDVLIERITTLEGERLEIRDVLNRQGLTKGSRLPVLTQPQAKALREFHESLAPDESFWTDQLANLEPLVVPYDRARRQVVGDRVLGPPDSARAALAFRRSTVQMPQHLSAFLHHLGGSEDQAAGLLAAVATYLFRLTDGGDSYHVGLVRDHLPSDLESFGCMVAQPLPLRLWVQASESFEQAWRAIREHIGLNGSRLPYLRDVWQRQPALRGVPRTLPTVLGKEDPNARPPEDSRLAIWASTDGTRLVWEHRPDALEDADVSRMQRQLLTFLADAAASPGRSVGELALLTDDEKRVLFEWNQTEVPYDRQLRIHDMLEAQAAQTPNAVALVAGHSRLSYDEMHRRANRLARYLQRLGVGPGVRVGVQLDRSAQLVVGLLAILKAGGAYVPMDPGYPAKRIQLILEDAKVPLVLSTRSLAQGLDAPGRRVLLLDVAADAVAAESDAPVLSRATSEDLAYVMYTSGSTGTPKGVMVTHRNVVNFFHGMDVELDHEPPGAWLAVTSISFDISILELFWTLARGFRVVLHTGDDDEPVRRAVRPAKRARELDFSLFYFGAGEGHSPDKYELLLTGARFADDNGFSAVWTPERHFHDFGGLYPNPSVLGAALATLTERIGIRAGSCVSPLHQAARIAEEWSVVDNLSGGRVGVSFASGWQPDDFVLAPENFISRKEVMLRQVDMVRRLWRGDDIWLPGPLGKDVKVSILPRPVQSDLPVWLTSAGSVDTFRTAGEMGCRVLTHLLGQSLEEVAEKITAYREAWRGAGWGPGDGYVTLMLHSFVGSSDEQVRDLVRAPMKAYLRSSVGLIQRAAWTFPAFKHSTTDQEGRFTLDNLSEAELDGVLDFSFERYYEGSGLLGSPAKCLRLVDQVREIGVDEIACLIDFVDSAKLALDHLPALDDVHKQATSTRPAARPVSSEGQHPVIRLIEEEEVTHLQCTPSMASMLLAMPGAENAFRRLRQLLVGGEAFPVGLARQLARMVPGSILNMYGPTESTIWSATHRLRGLDEAATEVVPIGRPIANTRLYILDHMLHPVPVGAVGELCIGGDGVSRGYLDRPELERERFLPDPFSGRRGDRMYRTGDLARFREGGLVEYLGRVDEQVKLRGYRIELGEIEAVLSTHPAVRETAVAVRSDGEEDRRLVAYVVPRAGKLPPAEELRRFLYEQLPEYMVPATFEVLDALPRTLNHKVDRRALPRPRGRQTNGSHLEPRDELERRLKEIWEQALNVQPIGVDENFFRLGGHSLLAVTVLHHVEESLGKRVPLATLFAGPTITELATVLRQSEESDGVAELLSVQPFGSKSPFFLVEAGLGPARLSEELGNQLAPDQPLNVIRPLALDSEEGPRVSLEEIARRCLVHVRSVQPKGPYLLGADRRGQAVVYEMAQQLRHLEEELALLVMVDDFGENGQTERRSLLGAIASDVTQRCRTLGRRLGTGRWSGRLGELEDDVQRRALNGPMEPEAAAVGYEWLPYPGRITLLRLEPSGPSSEKGWDRLAVGGIEVHHVAVASPSQSSARAAAVAAELANLVGQRGAEVSDRLPNRSAVGSGHGTDQRREAIDG